MIAGLGDSVLDGSNMVLLTGSARSGTSLVGRYIASLENVLYEFEPPVLKSLLLRSSDIGEVAFRELWLTHTVFHSAYGALSGRAFNMRVGDESSVSTFLHPDEIQERLGKSMRARDVLSQLGSERILIKLPDVLFSTERLRSLFPKLTLLATIREPASVIESLRAKQWYRFPDLGGSGLSTPLRASSFGPVPVWLGDSDSELWWRGQEADRCALHFLEAYPESVSGVDAVVDFDDVLRSGGSALCRLRDFLGLSEGRVSPVIRGSINQRVGKGGSTAVLQGDLLERCVHRWETWKGAAI